MNLRRSGFIVVGAVVVLAVMYGAGGISLQGSLLDSKSVARNLKQRADTDVSGSLSVKEIRKTLTEIIRGVVLGRQTEDVNGDGVVNRADVRATTQAFRALLLAFCGNGTLDIDEDCDDGNSAGGDGCSATCTVENRYRCTGTPSSCVELTGDEYVHVRLQTLPNGSANAGETIPVMRVSLEAFPDVTPAPVTASVAVTVNRGVISDVASVTAYQDTDGDGQYESQVGGPVTYQSVLGSNSFRMAELPIGTPGSPVHIELRAQLMPRVIVREISMKFPDPRLFPDIADTASVSFAGAAPDATDASLNGYCRLTTKVCPVRITTDGGTAPYYGITNPPCGSGTLDAGETCDDGNIAAGDGCSATCTIESGYTCTAIPSTCVPCGDGVVQSGQACDDGNTQNGDGCSTQCTVESGFECTGQPSQCVQSIRCGNGSIDGSDVCDDGNAQNGDGCSSTCTVETGYRCSGVPSTCTNAVLVETIATRLPYNLDSFAVAWDQEHRKAYIFGGETMSGGAIYHPRNVLVFDAASETFTVMNGQLPAGGLWNASAVFSPVNGKAYVFGGYSDRTVPDAYPVQIRAGILEYDPVADTVTTVASLPTARIWPTLVWDSTRNVAYAIGGTRGYAEGNPNHDGLYNDVVPEVVRFDPVTKAVSVVPFPYPEIGTIGDPAVYVPDHDKVFIFGYHGQDYTYNQGYLVLEFDPAASTVILHDDLLLPAEAGKGIYYDFQAFWDDQNDHVQLFGGMMYNAFYEPGATRYNKTYNYSFDPVALTFARAGDSSAEAQTEVTGIWDSVSRTAYLFGGYLKLPEQPGADFTYRDDVQKFSF